MCDSKKASRIQEPCPFCLSKAGSVYVHGHYQCLSCSTNIDPCCQGSPALSSSCGSLEAGSPGYSLKSGQKYRA